jgi:opacity protein-like surface antigen
MTPKEGAFMPSRAARASRNARLRYPLSPSASSYRPITYTGHLHLHWQLPTLSSGHPRIFRTNRLANTSAVTIERGTVMRHMLSTASIAAGLAGTLMLATMPVHAQQSADPSAGPIYGEGPYMGPYVGGGVGQYNVRIDNAQEFGSVINHYSTNDTAFKFFAGYRFAPFIALEGSYINLGTNKDVIAPGVVARSKIDGWSPELVATLPLGWFEAFAEGGDYVYRYQRCLEVPGTSFSSSSDTFNHIEWGAGLGVVVAQVIPIRLEYQEFNIQNTNHSNALWLTAGFRF